MVLSSRLSSRSSVFLCCCCDFQVWICPRQVPSILGFRLRFLLPRPRIPRFCCQIVYRFGFQVPLSCLVLDARVTFLCSVEFLYYFGFNWISVLNVQSEGKVCFKEGKGQSQLLYQLSLGHGKLLSCSGLSQSPILNFFFSATVSVRPVISGHLFTVVSECSVSVTQFYLDSRSCSLSPVAFSGSVSTLNLYGRRQYSVTRLCLGLVFIYYSMVCYHGCWLVGCSEIFGWNSGNRKIGNTTPSPIFIFFLYWTLF
jgi:hypothetical protein